MKRTPLKRNKPLSGGGGALKRSTKLAAISKKRRAALVIYREIRDEYMRANPKCCWPGCNSEATELHHARGRIGERGARLSNPEFFRGLCHEHHKRAHAEPLEAKALGISISSLKVTEEEP